MGPRAFDSRFSTWSLLRCCIDLFLRVWDASYDCLEHCLRNVLSPSFMLRRSPKGVAPAPLARWTMRNNQKNLAIVSLVILSTLQSRYYVTEHTYVNTCFTGVSIAQSTCLKKHVPLDVYKRRTTSTSN